ncbi:hypothetical protein BD31_I0041 [Candidatus Nitrosopumilus salaria BD31]|uniref:Uncharacterized protein n=1 Tax=Candidatus Nitrosopumilus salarius BD31 TaxID=859350 RepID=I3D2S3_9ARCH|nr:hypothetical protein [Candidatus Nitrosopumilus salaria]EIJ66016.1 hypothetical protein BD31_I0041 [Candidatus Nitrosopumilus salaria BD31]
MNHVIYSNGDAQKITWVIQNEDSSFVENREHVDMYKDKVTKLQSKYVALHVGLFWGIGTFIIKNEDTVKIKLDEKIMFDQFTNDLKIEDSFIQKRLRFIKQLIDQRKLKIRFELIDQDENIAKNNI